MFCMWNSLSYNQDLSTLVFFISWKRYLFVYSLARLWNRIETRQCLDSKLCVMKIALSSALHGLISISESDHLPTRVTTEYLKVLCGPSSPSPIPSVCSPLTQKIWLRRTQVCSYQTMSELQLDTQSLTETIQVPSALVSWLVNKKSINCPMIFTNPQSLLKCMHPIPRVTTSSLQKFMLLWTIERNFGDSLWPHHSIYTHWL